jgi:hypothetical protein
MDDFDDIQCEDLYDDSLLEEDDSCYEQELEDFYGTTIFDQANLFE